MLQSPMIVLAFIPIIHVCASLSSINIVKLKYSSNIEDLK